MIPLFKTTAEAKEAQPQADVLLSFASFRTAYEVTMEALEIGGFSSMMITAEGIPERVITLVSLLCFSILMALSTDFAKVLLAG